jgi:hypothetical protein
LAIGVGENEYSDLMPPFIEYTSNAIYILKTKKWPLVMLKQAIKKLEK